MRSVPNTKRNMRMCDWGALGLPPRLASRIQSNASLAAASVPFHVSFSPAFIVHCGAANIIHIENSTHMQNHVRRNKRRRVRHAAATAAAAGFAHTPSPCSVLCAVHSAAKYIAKINNTRRALLCRAVCRHKHFLSSIRARSRGGSGCSQKNTFRAYIYSVYQLKFNDASVLSNRTENSLSMITASVNRGRISREHVVDEMFKARTFMQNLKLYLRNYYIIISTCSI